MTMRCQKGNNKRERSFLTKFFLGLNGRIFLGFLTIIIALMCTTLYVNNKIKTAGIFANEISNTAFPTINAYLDLNGYIYASQAMATNYLITHDETYKNNFNNVWKLINDNISIIDDIKESWHNDDISKDWESSKALIKEVYAAETKLITVSNSQNNTEMTIALSNEVQDKINHAMDMLDGPIQADKTRSGGLYHKSYWQWEDVAKHTSTDLTNVNDIQHLLLLFYIVFGISVAIITARSILKPLRSAITIAGEIANGERNIEIVVNSNDETGELLTALDIMLKAIQENEAKLIENETRTRTLLDNIIQTANAFSEHSSRVAKGDLTKRITKDNIAEMRELGHDLNAMTENLANITSRITDASHNMVTTLEEVKQAVEVQSTGAAEQASSINQITASLEEIEKSSLQTIEKTNALGEVAERTREKGQLGLEAVEQSIQGMKSIREKVQTIAKTILDLSHQTQQVGEITNVVNTLAQQSKMLALNASIEAAKAGEAGKGFAVVAAEVKNLAEQSEHSTTQVQKILEDIRRATEKAVMATEEGAKGVDHGTELIEQTGEVVRNLSDVIHETTIASEQIAAAIRQEGIGIEQISAGMNEINQVTASFVTSVKQTTEAIDNLTAIAKSLKQNVDIYKI